MHELKKNYTIIIVTHNMQQALRVSDMTAFFNAIEYKDGDGGKVGYLAEFNSTNKIFNSPKEKTTQEYISGKFGWIYVIIFPNKLSNNYILKYKFFLQMLL